MNIDSLKSAIPEPAKDIRLNLSSITESEALSETQLWGTLLAAAFAARNPKVIKAVAEDARGHLDGAAMDAARAAAAVMAMNNVYYRAVHLIGDPEYGRMPARLRMNAIAKPGVDKVDFEIFCLAVSAVNGCDMCLESHAREITGKGASREAVQAALRIAAVAHAAACVIEAEDCLATVDA